jgi:UDP:flavonoid glycosyltransferase YjiC (YdhE family)
VSRFLLVVAPLVGHVTPLRAVAARLAARGHEIAWAGAGAWLRPLLGSDATIFDCAPGRFGEPTIRPVDVHGAAALRFLIEEYLVPLAIAMLPETSAAIASFGADVVVADQQTYAGAFAAHRAGLPWATSASTSAELVEPFSPAIAGWIREQLAAAWTATGGAGLGPDPRLSPSLIITFTTPELAGPVPGAPPWLRWVGPALADTDIGWSPPWAERRPLVLVTLGTANSQTGERFLRACADALAGRADLHTVVVDPTGAAGPSRDTMLVVAKISQLGVLPYASAVVCHAGHNTVCESLWHGVPLVVAPIRDDQPVIAGQVVAAGAGRRLRFAHAGPGHVAAAVDAVLNDPSYAAAAARIGQSFRAAGGAEAAASALDALATARNGQRISTL